MSSVARPLDAAGLPNRVKASSFADVSVAELKRCWLVGFDIRTFECRVCKDINQVAADLVDPMKSPRTTAGFTVNCKRQHSGCTLLGGVSVPFGPNMRINQAW